MDMVESKRQPLGCSRLSQLKTGTCNQHLECLDVLRSGPLLIGKYNCSVSISFPSQSVVSKPALVQLWLWWVYNPLPLKANWFGIALNVGDRPRKGAKGLKACREGGVAARL